MEWSYQGQNGPEYWSRLCTDFKKAEEEASWQSPIPLNTAATRQEPKKDDTILFKKEKVKMKTDFFNHTVHLSPAEGNEASVVFQDKMYVLQDIHAHLPSEHTIDDHSFEMEIHLCIVLTMINYWCAVSWDNLITVLYRLYQEICTIDF